MRVVNVVPNIELKVMLTCDMWMAKGPTHDPVPILGHLEEWEEVQK